MDSHYVRRSTIWEFSGEVKRSAVLISDSSLPVVCELLVIRTTQNGSVLIKTWLCGLNTYFASIRSYDGFHDTNE